MPALSTRGAASLAASSSFSARRRYLVFVLAAGLAILGRRERAALAARRAAGSLGHPGDHRDRVDGAQPQPDRGSGHLPDRDDVPRRARRSRPSAASRCSGCRSCTSSSRTARTSTGRARGSSSTSRRVQRPAARPGVTPQIGPDATSVGWVYQYALVDESGKHDAPGAALVPGLVAALLAAERRRASPRSRASAGSRSSTRSRSIRCA